MAPHFVTFFQNNDNMMGGPKHVAKPAHANTANQKTESKGFNAIIIDITPRTIVEI